MKVAFCLYGQPRMIDEGYKYIQEFINRHKDVEFDFFYHTWYIDPCDDKPMYYDGAPWRNSPNSIELIIKKDIINRINELYKPKAGYYENPRYFDNSIVKPSLLYENTISKCGKNTDNVINNISNTLSCIYTCQKVRDILLEWIKKNNIQYDFVVSSRFDFLNSININLHTLDSSKLYTSNMHVPRNIIAGANFYISNVDIFLNFFNTYDNISILKNNESIFNKINSFKEMFIVNVEQLITSNYLYYYKNFENIIETNLIPNFR
jgi:hypothetical protein